MYKLNYPNKTDETILNKNYYEKTADFEWD